MPKISFCLSVKNNPVTDSRKVAEKFGKRHADVLRDIETAIVNIVQSADIQNERKIALVEKYFYKSKYIDQKGEERPLYIMNYDGFTLLTMGFTGAKAMSFKLEYIAEF